MSGTKQTIIKEVEARDPANSPDGMAVRLKGVEAEVRGLRQDMKDGLKEINASLVNAATTHYVDKAVSEVTKRVQELENGKRWIVRTVVGALVIALISLILSGSVHWIGG